MLEARGPVVLSILALLLCLSCSSSSGFTSTDSAGQMAVNQECSVVGIWRGLIRGGVLAGRMVELTFWDNHVARGTAGAIMLEVSWEFEQGVLSIIHRDSLPPAAACRLDQVGRYRVEFSADCRSALVSSIDDSCEHRRRTLDALQTRRQ